MRRLAVLVGSVVLVVVAFSLEAPPVLDPDPATSTTIAPEEVVLSRFFHCPWALADDRRDGSFAMVSAVDTDFAINFPENGAVEQGPEGVVLPDAAFAVDNERVLGTSSAIVEFSNGPAAASVVAIGESTLAGDLCSANLPAVWHVPGGSTLEGDTLTLRLFNPFADDARVDLSAVSELGPESDDSFEAVSVPPRSTRTLELERTLPGREALSLFVEHVEGSVIPVMVQGSGTDTAVWPGTRHSDIWEFPLAGTEALATELILTNVAPIDVVYTVEVFDESASVLSGVGGTIAGPGQARVPLVGLGPEVFGVRVTADGPFGAVVVGKGETSRVGTVGAPTTADRWLIPGPNAETAADYRLWFLNTGVDSVTITYVKANATGTGDVASIEVASGAMASVDVTDIGTTGMTASGTGPFSVAWSGSNGPARMFSGAVPIGN